jgi:signal transduction histidine kinase
VRGASRFARLSPRRLPISLRLGATFAVVFFAVLVGISALAYWGLGQTLRGELDRGLAGAAGALERSGSSTAGAEEQQVGGVQSAEYQTQVIGADGRVVRASEDDLLGRPVLSAARAAEVRREGAVFADVTDAEGEHLRAIALPMPRRPSRVLVVLAELDSVADAQAGLLQLAVTLSPLACLMAGGAGYLVARRGLRPIAAMTADAERFSARDPFPRLAVPRTDDEVARLGATLNGLLDRIEEVRRREREFTADASHELRTPLAILRAELELARGHATEAGFVTALDSALEECDRLNHLIDDLMLLARADAGQAGGQTLVRVGQVADELMPGFRTLAGRRGITVSRSGDAVVHADPRALGRALANLLDNAIRHSPDGGTVTLDIAPRADGTAITVTDDGPGVPPEQRARMVQRFAQLDRSRGANGGAGLGLSIVSAVAAAQHGQLEIADGPAGRGLAVTLRLPAPAQGTAVR